MQLDGEVGVDAKAGLESAWITLVHLLRVCLEMRWAVWVLLPTLPISTCPMCLWQQLRRLVSKGRVGSVVIGGVVSEAGEVLTATLRIQDCRFAYGSLDLFQNIIVHMLMRNYQLGRDVAIYATDTLLRYFRNSTFWAQHSSL